MAEQHDGSAPSRSNWVALFSLMTLISVSTSVRAEYVFETVIPPGVGNVQTFGINNAGTVTGGGDGDAFSFDMKRGTYAKIDPDLGILDISNSGVMVGGTSENVCMIRDRKGKISMFNPPSYSPGDFCQARGVNSNGKVSGYTVDQDFVWRGFIYDSKNGTFEEFLSSAQTIAHAINNQGQNVGSVNLAPGEAYPGSAGGRYGYRRDAGGAVKYFSVDQSWPGQTRARGISESGLVTGFYVDASTFELKSFVFELDSDTASEHITLADDQLLYVKPCDPNVAAPPGPGYDLYTEVASSQIRNDGTVVGNCVDSYYNPSTGDFISHYRGFIATPSK